MTMGSVVSQAIRTGTGVCLYDGWRQGVRLATEGTKTQKGGDGMGTHGRRGGAVRPHGWQGEAVGHARVEEGSGEARTGGWVKRCLWARHRLATSSL